MIETVKFVEESANGILIILLASILFEAAVVNIRQNNKLNDN